MTIHKVPIDEENILFNGVTTYTYAIRHRQYADELSYVKGTINPYVFPLLLSYIQIQMKELEEHVTLFPHDIAKILENIYGFQPSLPCEDCRVYELTQTIQEQEGNEETVLLLPFYRKGLYKELQQIVQQILAHFNGE